MSVCVSACTSCVCYTEWHSVVYQKLKNDCDNWGALYNIYIWPTIWEEIFLIDDITHMLIKYYKEYDFQKPNSLVFLHLCHSYVHKFELNTIIYLLTEICLLINFSSCPYRFYKSPLNHCCYFYFAISLFEFTLISHQQLHI